MFVESESKKVGNVSIPLALLEKMRASACLDLQLPTDERVALLLEDYDYLVKNTAYFCERLDILSAFKGKLVVAAWKDKVQQGDLEPVVRDLLTGHYDPGYLESIRRNFSQYEAARALVPESHSMEAMLKLAKTLL